MGIKTAGLIIIGDEILSGRTLDKNTQTIAIRLGEIGIQLRQVQIIPDVIDTIIETVQHYSSTFDYVFTTGGIGPTHDDKTAEAIAKAFNVALIRHPDAYAALIDHYEGEENLNEGRIKMTMIPETASLIDNPVSAAPGFKIQNVHVMAGVPNIMQGMLDNVIPTLEGGEIIKTRSIIVHKKESEIASLLQKTQEDYPQVDIGSYPRYVEGRHEVSIVIRGTDEGLIESIEKHLMNELGQPQKTDWH
jgi:molybdenum cofactor synthesis domain-containing protein